MTVLSSLSALDVQRNSLPQASVGTVGARFDAPRNEVECDRLLDVMEQRHKLGAGDVAPQLAPFLGVTNRIWTSARKDRLARILLWQPDGVREILREVFDAPRVEVMDDAIRALAHDGARRQLYAGLLEGAPIAVPGLAELVASPDVRLTLVRVLGRLPGVLDEAERRALQHAITDSVGDVREAAAVVLGRRGAAEVVPLLLARQAEEPSDLVKAAIDEAIDEIQTR